MNEKENSKQEKRRDLILKGNLIKVLAILALPQVLTMLIDSLYNLADTFFVSGIGDAATAAVSVNDSTMMIIRGIALTFGMGASSVISRLMGAKEDEKASRVASTTCITAVGIIIIISALGLIFAEPICRFMGATESALPYSAAYARWTFVFAPFTGAAVCLAQVLRAEGSATMAMIGSVSGCVINCFLDPLFINGFGLGVGGAAIATGVSKVIGCGILLFPFITKKSMLDLKLKYFTPKKYIFGDIVKMGVPIGLRTGFMALSTIIINNIAGGYGDVALAAVSVANKSMRTVGSAVMGFGQGFQPIAGFCWGAGDFKRVKKAYLLTSAIGLGLGVILGVILFIVSKDVMAVFTNNPETMRLGDILIRSQCVVLPVHVWGMISVGLFQGCGKAVRSAVLGLSRNLFSLIPVTIILNAVFGLMGLCLSQAAADVVTAIISVCMVVPMLKELDKLAAGLPVGKKKKKDELFDH
ncbi:MAG: MATE family efflux transporter [Parasporobacterium sp.]|nr:MATE family efflux transporter [Parasporobacterium sp.]